MLIHCGECRQEISRHTESYVKCVRRITAQDWDSHQERVAAGRATRLRAIAAGTAT